jgi:hypothetical protein
LRYISLAFWRLAVGACLSLGPFYLVATLLVSAALTRDADTVTVVARSTTAPRGWTARSQEHFNGCGNAFGQGRNIDGSEGPKTKPT